MTHSLRRRFACTISVAVALVLSAHRASATPITALPDLSLLTPYTTFGHFFNLNLATVAGNAGISNGGELLISAPSSITGNLFLGAGATVSGSGTIGGSTFTNQNLIAAQHQVITASTVLEGLAADYTVGSVTTQQTFNAVGPVTVIDIGSISGNGDILLNGSASSVFVVNVSGDAQFTGSTGITGENGVTADNVLINLYNSSLGNLGLVAHINDVLNGTILVPYDAATFHSENGAIYAGNGEITLMSGATVTPEAFIPAPSVPEPATLVLLGTGLLAVARRRRRPRRS